MLHYYCKYVSCGARSFMLSQMVPRSTTRAESFHVLRWREHCAGFDRCCSLPEVFFVRVIAPLIISISLHHVVRIFHWPAAPSKSPLKILLCNWNQKGNMLASWFQSHKLVFLFTNACSWLGCDDLHVWVSWHRPRLCKDTRRNLLDQHSSPSSPAPCLAQWPTSSSKGASNRA